MLRRNTPRQEARRESRQERRESRHDRAAGVAEALGWQPNPVDEVRHLRTREAKRAHITNSIDNHGFDWLVVMVAGSGFFTDSFNLFSTNVTLPILSDLYWSNVTNESPDTLINCFTLAGSIVGQILFGILADYFGRQRLYGIELVVVIIATVGIVEASQGIHKWMDIKAVLGFWRFVMGVGIGAEYPLSATICTEWAAKSVRGRMMASVFFAQPLGQLFAALVGLWVTLGQRDSSTVSMDKIWRIVSSVGALPAVVAIIFRFTITDPGRYTLDVQNEGERAVNDTDTHFGISRESLVSSASEMVGEAQQEVHQEPIEQDEPLPEQFTYADIKQYFYSEGNWRYLAGTSLCWFLLDFAFFGLGLNNPDTLADIWDEARIGPMHQLLLNDARRSLITVSIGSVLGILVLITFIDRVSRRRILIHSFFGLGLLFVFTGMSYLLAMKHRAHILTIVLSSICEFVFNLGPNTLTFIIPAEIFPTRYRATCHGLSAAAGKFGSIIVQIILSTARGWILQPKTGLGWLFIIFAFIMMSGALFAWAWLPEVQEYVTNEKGETKLDNKSLEDLGEGLRRAEMDGEIIGLRKKVTAVLRRWL